MSMDREALGVALRLQSQAGGRTGSWQTVTLRPLFTVSQDYAQARFDAYFDQKRKLRV
jgi:hypothetical protein